MSGQRAAARARLFTLQLLQRSGIDGRASVSSFAAFVHRRQDLRDESERAAGTF